MTAGVYPWQHKHMERLIGQQALDKLPHALLLSGPAYVGKRDFAVALSARLLCRSSKGGQPCGDCAECHLFDAGTHPDFHLIQPEDSRQILIEQIRALIDWVNQTSQRGGLKIVLVHPAEKMNANAANALLKCLEEPARETLIILVSDLPGRLLPTIRSRCQRVSFAIPSRGEALQWLENERSDLGDPALLLDIAGGAPLAVKRRYDAQFLERRSQVGKIIGQLWARGDVLVLAEKLVQADAELALDVMHSLLADALRVSLTGDLKYIKNKDMYNIIKVICAELSRRSLLAACQAVSREQLALTGPHNPNPQLLVESLLVEIAGLCAL